MPFTILDRKDAELAPLPLLLVTVTWKSGQVLRLCSHKTGVNYGGHAYEARILNGNVAAQQILGEQGIDFAPSVTLKLADADKWVWTNHEKARGFKGAKLVAFFVFFDAIAGEYSTDSYTKFVGTCDAPSFDETTLTLQARSKMNMSAAQLPPTRIQKLCPWIFPPTAADRQAGADDPTSKFYRCGYSPDATGSNARGNANSGTGYDYGPFPTCDYTYDNCKRRGMYSQDSASRVTGRFGGIQWVPVGTLITRGFRSDWEQIVNTGNDSRYNDLVPWCLGVVSIDPPVINVVADGNYTKCEVLLSEGEIADIVRIIVNDVEIPHTFDDTEISTPPGVSNTQEALKIGFWKTVNRGDRDGAPNTDALFAGMGDPYGSFAVLSIAVVRAIAGPGSAPRVQVILKGAKIRVFTDSSTSTLEFSENPAWHLLAILSRVGWQDEEIDIDSFIASAAFCDEAIPYKNQFLQDATHPRFKSGMVLRTRKSAADVIRGIRNANRMILTQDWGAGGKLQLSHRNTLAKEQPAVVPGSNDTATVASMLPNGTTANGYLAYHFDESGIMGSLEVKQGNNTPNQIGFQFLNEDNRYSADSVALAETEDIDRVGLPTATTIAIEGVMNWDQARRIIATMEAEGFRGNPRRDIYDEPIGDTGGTLEATFTTTFRAIHLRAGQIVALSWQHLGLVRQPFRVTHMEPSADFATLKITATWHNDYWYLDTFGQAGAPRYRSPHRNPNLRGVYSWLPFGDVSNSGDAWRGSDDFGFRIAQSYDAAADGSTIARLTFRGKHPVNKVLASNPPYVPLQGTTASTGGSIPGGRTYYVAITSGENLTGFETYQTAPSQLVTIAIPAGTNTNTATVSGIVWENEARRGWVYIGIDPTRLVQIQDVAVFAEGAGPSTVTVTDLPQDTFGVPDLEYDHLEFEVYKMLMSGVWVAKVTAVTSSSVTVALPGGESFVADEWAGRDLSVLAISGSGDFVPFATFPVSGNTTDGTINLSAGDPTHLWNSGGDPDPYSLKAGDIVVMRAKFTAGAGYIEDTKFVNIFHPAGLAADSLEGGIFGWLFGTGRGTSSIVTANDATKIYADFAVTPDSTSRGIVIESSVAARGRGTSGAESWDVNNSIDVAMDVANATGQGYMVLGLTANDLGEVANRNNSPWREIYLIGGPGAGQGSLGLQLTVGGTLAIGSDLAPRTQLARTVRATGVRAEVKQAPTGADLAVTIKLTTTDWLTLTIADGTTSIEATPTEIAAAADITAATNIRLDVTGAGTTFPGADLTVSIYL
ncbi:MAG: DUF2163 domain-containing protein [Nitrospirae bacterium]|nr:MAG: DUF2163 domain-containing protein [Nitrospirota bacterium]